MSKCKYEIGEKVYLFNLGMQNPLIAEMIINGIVNNDDGFYYTPDKKVWIKEEFIFKARMEAYRALIQQSENEMNHPDLGK